MEKRIFDFTDSRLLAHTASPYELGVVAGTDGFSMLVADPTGEVLALKAWHFDNPNGDFPAVEAELRQTLGGEPLLSASFPHVRCALANRQATIVPRRLFNPDHLPAYFHLLLPAGDYVYDYAELADLDCMLIYALDAPTHRLLQQYFPPESRSHLAASLLRRWQGLAPANGPQVFVNLRNEIAQIALFERRNLLFYNAFNFNTASDFLYFVLLAYDQGRLSPLEAPLLLCGELLEESEIYRLLYRYVRHLHFGSARDRYQLPGELNALPSHFYFDLFSLKTL